MRQFLLAEPPDKDGFVRLGGKDYHYLVNVRRVKPGGTFTALLPLGNTRDSTSPGANSGRLITVSILNIDGHTLKGSVIPQPILPVACDTTGEIPPIILFQGLPREAKMDVIVRQAAETGISEIVPFITERSTPKEHFRTERWQRIIREARQQSGSPIDTRIRPPLTGDELFAYWKELSIKIDSQKVDSQKTGSPLGIVFNPDTAGELANDGLEKGVFHHYLSKECSLIVLAVGPEGGLSAAEFDRFTAAGFKPLNMGSTVLRTETAALYGAAAVRITLMEKAWWMLKQQ